MSEGMLRNELDKELKMLELGVEWGEPRLKGWGNHRREDIRPYIVVSQGLEVPGVGEQEKAGAVEVSR